MVNLSKLEEIKDLRTVWPHEALDFTPWLSQDDNIALLADAVGLDITVDETESSVGDFNVDIFASETGTDRKIIIENQLEDTNHDHLGKLITYASGKSADVIIWVVKHAREEHKAAIEWLNNHSDEKIGFFLCEIKLYRIGTSEPAVKFEVIEKPNDWTKEVKKSESANETQQQRYGHVDDDTPSFAISLFKEYRGQGIGSQLMVKMLELLIWQGYERASLAVQKANYAVKMYENVGFKIVDENAEEYIMVCEL